MSEVALLLQVVALLVGVPVFFALLGRRARRRGLGYAVMSPLEEVFAPGSHRANVEVHAHVERAAPSPGVAPRR
ncbi:hypothetical protein ACI78T_16835 [Blastococcus sp. SYSU D00922]